MTTFVDTSVLLSGTEADDQDPVVVVVRSAQPMLREAMGEEAGSAFESAFTEKYLQKNYCGVFDLLLSNSEIVFSKLSAEKSGEVVVRIAKTAEGYFEVVLSVLSKLESVDDVSARVNAFTAKMAIRTESVPVDGLKLRLLISLFNIFSVRTQLRLTVAKALCEFAKGNAKSEATVFPLVRDVDVWVAEFGWEKEVGGLFGLVADIAPENEKIKYMRLGVLAGASAEQLIVSALSLPSVVSFVELEGIAIVDPDLAKCMQILTSGSFAEMEQFIKVAPGSLCAKHGIDTSALLEKMRVISVGQLRESSIAEIGKKLNSPDPLALVVKALKLGVVQGAINEVEGRIEVRAALPRTSAEAVKINQELNRMNK